MQIVIEVESGMVIGVSAASDSLPLEVAVVDYDLWGGGTVDDGEDITQVLGRDGLARVYGFEPMQDTPFVAAVFAYVAGSTKPGLGAAPVQS